MMKKYLVLDNEGHAVLESDCLADAINLAHEHEDDKWCVWDTEKKDYVEY